MRRIRIILYSSAWTKFPESEYGQFDVIVSLEVIEHLPDPHYYIEKFEKLLRKGGALYMTTPNFNSLSRHILGSNWNNIVFPETLYVISQKKQ